MWNERIILKEVDCVVVKNSTFKVNPAQKEWDWDPTTHDVYKHYVWWYAQSIQLSDQKDTYKFWAWPWELDDVRFWLNWKLVIYFEPNL
jgi:hypothetical protein